MEEFSVELESTTISFDQDRLYMRNSDIIGAGIIDSNERHLINDFPVTNSTDELVADCGSGVWCWKFFERNDALFEDPFGQDKVRWDHHKRGLIPWGPEVGS